MLLPNLSMALLKLLMTLLMSAALLMSTALLMSAALSSLSTALSAYEKLPASTMITAIRPMMLMAIMQELHPMDILRYLFLSSGGRVAYCSERSENTKLAKYRQAGTLRIYVYLGLETVNMSSVNAFVTQ